MLLHTIYKYIKCDPQNDLQEQVKELNTIKFREKFSGIDGINSLGRSELFSYESQSLMIIHEKYNYFV